VTVLFGGARRKGSGASSKWLTIRANRSRTETTPGQADSVDSGGGLGDFDPADGGEEPPDPTLETPAGDPVL
jgi:hypothetical protein